MPELAEVEYYRKKWSPGLGESVAIVLVHAEKRIFRGVDMNAMQQGLKGQVLEHSETHGKQMLFHFGERHYLGVHLGMTGQTSAQPSSYEPGKHDHLVIEMQSGIQLVFTDPRLFGRIRYDCGESPPKWWAELPPEVLSDAFTEERFETFLQRRARSPIKAVLLMQEFFPGIGNWMADEILWRARIHPATQSGKIGPKKRAELLERIQEVCRDALEVIGTDWGTPPDDWLFNHRWKDGGVCPQTGCDLAREEIGGRTTCWSPKWQTYRGKS